MIATLHGDCRLQPHAVPDTCADAVVADPRIMGAT
jgi:hypothetical protein